MQISHIELADSSKVCFRAMEIIAIPSISIMPYPSEADARGATTELISRTLTEVSQIYKSLQQKRSVSDLALELLWATEPVSNQVFEARIRMILTFRCISSSVSAGDSAINTIYSVFQNALEVNRFTISSIDFEEVTELLRTAQKEQITALVKDCRIDKFQAAALPQCFSYDCFGTDSPATEILVNSLLHCPNSVVAIQLVPTEFSIGEENLIDGTCQALGMLARGMMNPGWGNIVLESAKQSYESYSYYNNNKNHALFQYNILICGRKASVAEISSSLKSQLRGKATANMRAIQLPPSVLKFDENYYPAPWTVQEYIAEKYAAILPGISYECTRLPLVITAEEASPLFTTPIGGPSIQAGFQINESDQANKQYGEGLIDSGDISIGRLKNKTSTIGINLKDIAKHMLVVGTPGSGKTTFSISLLDRLWKEHHIPFLVIEPAKNEYRALVQSIPDLQVFTPGKNTISPFVYNPFLLPKNVKLETYKSTLKTAFAAAVSMSSPLDKIFEESINNCYADYDWLDTDTSDGKGRIFNIADFIRCFKETFNKIGYTGDARNIGRAGVVRLASLANLFDNYYSIPIEDLLKKPTVIELAAIENSEQKALMISLLLLSVLSYVNANYVGEGGLHNVILLEEAHVLLDADSNSNLSDANPSAIAQGLIKRMLAEIRSYGVGIMIADQSPRKVSSDVVALTDIKMVFRLVEATDKTIVSDSTNMSEAQTKRLSRLKPGEAYLFFNRLEEPEEVVTPDYRLEQNIKISLSDQAIQELSTYWKKNPERLRPYPQCQYCRYCQKGCNYNRRIYAREIARRVFVHNFHTSDSSIETIQKVFKQIVQLTRREMRGEKLSKETYSCIKVHLWRKLRYDTVIQIPDRMINDSIAKE